MAERSYLWPTTGTGDGPSGGYPYTQVAELMEGLYPTGVLWELGVTISGFNAIVGVGKAIIQGIVYTNDAPLSLSVTNPGSGNTRRDLVVLRGNASARTVRAVIKAGVVNSGVYPTLQQDAAYPASGVFEIQLARLIVTSTNVALDGGPQMTIPRGVVGTAQIADGAVTSAKIADGAIATADIANGAVTRPKLSFNPPEITHYFGGTTWGSTNPPALRTTSAAVRVLAGGADVVIPANQNLGVYDVSASGVFSAPPYVLATAVDQQTILASVALVTTSSWRLRAHETAGTAGFARTIAVHFVAIGPAA